MSSKEMLLRYPAYFDEFEEYIKNFSDEELGEIFRLALKKTKSEIKHKSNTGLCAALALHREIGIWRKNDFYAKQGTENFVDALKYLAKSKAS